MTESAPDAPSSSHPSRIAATVAASDLRWTCDEELGVDDTSAVAPLHGLEHQRIAIDALTFGMDCGGTGHNMFVRGLRGGRRLELVAELIREHLVGDGPSIEYAYVCNFAAPDRPQLLRLPVGAGQEFKHKVKKLAKFIRDELSTALESDALKMRREALERREQDAMSAVTGPFGEALKEAGLELVSVQHGDSAVPAIFPLVDDEPLAPEDFEEKYEAGEIGEEKYGEYRENLQKFEEQLAEITSRVSGILRLYADRRKELMESPARTLLRRRTEPIHQAFPGEDVRHFLDSLIEDVVENRIEKGMLASYDPVSFYGVNILEPRKPDAPRPVIVENHPSLSNLIGNVEHDSRHSDPSLFDDHRLIRPGSLLRADGGCLVIDARDLLSEKSAWSVIVRTLRAEELQIAAPELKSSSASPSLKPDPIPLSVRIVLVGDAKTYRKLETNEPDFADLFKVLADFESTLPRDCDSVKTYAGVLARLVSREPLPPFDLSGICAVAEQGARFADAPKRLTTHFDQIEDLAREAAYLARQKGSTSVVRQDVEEAFARASERANLAARRYRMLLEAGTYNVSTSGLEIGQVNGLAVMRSAQLPYALPARVTAAIGPGTKGFVDIESEASLSGNIHKKAFHILGGLLRHLLEADHPLTLSASIAFEQNYGRIEGDSASGAEACCLLSCLAGVPIDQGVAMTGAVDQRGRIQAVGGVNEKIEGFYDACQSMSLTGSQGVILPRDNVGALMLRRDVVEACVEGRFHVYAVDSLREALEILTGIRVGERDADGHYPEDTLLGRAAARARALWRASTRRYSEDD